jgi:formylglycine-generating enzyme required for sulfatase activity
VVILLAVTAVLVHGAIAREHAHRAAGYRRLAGQRFSAGRLDEADELAAMADSLVSGDPATAELVNRLKDERRDDMIDAIDRGDVTRAWRNWKKLRPADFAKGQEFDQEIPLQAVQLVSKLPGTRVVFHALRPDGQPKLAAPLYEVTARSHEGSFLTITPARHGELSLISGAYWVTGFIEGTGQFVERPFELKRDHSGGTLIPLLWLDAKTTPEATSGMVEIPGGTLRMGSNKVIPGPGSARSFPPEYPEHDVELADFYLDRTEVTNQAFLSFLKETGREAWGKNVWPASGGRPEEKQLDWPVTRVTYAEAVEFAAWRGCSLPDESQLEWAARGPAGAEGPAAIAASGPPAEWTGLHGVVADPRDQTIIRGEPVFGLQGNAGELTLFRYRPYPSRAQFVSGSSARFGFVVRSGLFRESAGGNVLLLGFIKRASLLPEARNDHVGFRCARSINPRIPVLPQFHAQE